MTDWSVIVEQHGPLVWRTVYRLLNNEADAADCFQSAFLAAFELTTKSEVRNWAGLLKRLATVQALDRLRVRYRDRDRHTSWPEDGVTDLQVDPLRVLENAELADRLRIALTTIDDRQAEVFCLACLEGFRYREIGNQLRLSVNHVGVLLNRAKASLRELLADQRPTETEL